jgi:excisionase family DNA binding protein
MTAKEVAEYVKHHDRTVLNAARCGELVGYQRRAPHGTWRFKLDDVEKWISGKR